MTSAESVEPVEPHREAIAVDPPTKEAQRLWQKLGELAVEFGAERDWCLVGGLMVQLHAYSMGWNPAPPPTSTSSAMLAGARA